MTKLTCIECGDPDATVSMSLDGQHTCTCSSCDAEFTPAEAVRALTAKLEQWRAVAEWADAFPVARKARVARTA